MSNCPTCNQPVPARTDEGGAEAPESQLQAFYDVALAGRGDLANRVMDALVNRT